MKKANKYLYGYGLMVNYGHGWEYEVFETSFRDIKERREEYRLNCPQYPCKIVRKREPNAITA